MLASELNAARLVSNLVTSDICRADAEFSGSR